MVRGAGGQLVGFEALAPAAAVDWMSMKGMSLINSLISFKTFNLG
jgi:hypothetical protein